MNRTKLLTLVLLFSAVLYRVIGTKIGDYIMESSTAQLLANLTGLQASYLLMVLGYAAGYTWSEPLGLIHLSSGAVVPAIAISAACSGILSLGIFLASFAVLTADFYGRTSRTRLVSCLILGLGGTILANVVRVSLISMVGFLWGPEPMYSFHTYAGYLTFLVFMTVFWYLSISWLKESRNWHHL